MARIFDGDLFSESPVRVVARTWPSARQGILHTTKSYFRDFKQETFARARTRPKGQKAHSAKRQTLATRANSGIQRISIVNARAIIKYIVYNFKDANEARLMTVNAVS